MLTNQAFVHAHYDRHNLGHGAVWAFCFRRQEEHADLWCPSQHWSKDVYHSMVGFVVLHCQFNYMAGSTFLLLHLNGKPVAGLYLHIHSPENCDLSIEPIADGGPRYCIACFHSAYSAVIGTSARYISSKKVCIA